MPRSLIFNLGGLLALFLISCCTATPTQNTASSSSSSYVLKDTLPGIVNTGLVVRNSSEPESTSITYMKNFGSNLVIATTYGEFYVRNNGVWQNLKLPNGDLSGYLHTIAVKDSETIYLLGRLSLWEWNIKSGFKQVNTIAKTEWCLAKYEKNCKFKNIFSFNNILILETSMGYVDSLGIPSGYVMLSSDFGITWQDMPSFPKITPSDESIRNLTYDGKNIWVATWQRGIWYYNGAKWDSIPYYQFKNTRSNIEYPVKKYGGVAVLNGVVYAGEYGGFIHRISPTNTIEFIAPTLDYTYSQYNLSGPKAFSYGLDTACGALINNNSWQYWKPGMPDWASIIDTTDKEFAYAKTENKPINIAQTLASVRVGDTLFISYTGGGTDTHNGGVVAFDLRQARWCTDAWDRGKAWRDSIGVAQKKRLEGK